MSESLAQSIADSYWPEVRKWALAHPKSDPFRSGHVFLWAENDADKCCHTEGAWNCRDIAKRSVEILRERVAELRKASRI